MIRRPLIVSLLMVFAIGSGVGGGVSARERAGMEGLAGERPLQRPPVTLKVGPGGDFAKPSQAVASVHSGDTVVIAPGTYEDCVIWPKNIRGLTIEGNGAVITGRPCAGKALFVIAASDVTVRGLTFRGAKVPDHNGAGIRSEGVNLTVENSRFINNENGILAGRNPNNTIIVQGSYFEGNGSCEGPCAHGIYAGAVKSLRVVQSTFVGQHHGHHIKSRALFTDIANNEIKDGPRGNASYLIDIPNGGTVSIRGNRMQKGPHSENGAVAIMIGEDAGKQSGLHPSTGIRIEGNQFTNDMPYKTNFVRSVAEARVTLANNTLSGDVTPLFERP